MDLKQHSAYLFSVAMPELEELYSWNDFLINEYKQRISTFPGFNDLPLYSTDPRFKEFRDFLLPLIHQKVQKYFIVDELWGYDIDGLNVYIQEGVSRDEAQQYKNSNKGYHNHIEDGYNLTGTCYLSLPKVGGEFETMHLPRWLSHITKPELLRFYFFPSWLYHRPLPQQDKEPRICINWVGRGEKKPILKRFNKIW